MNFFKSVFSDDPDPPTSKSGSESPQKSPQGDDSDPDSHPNSNPNSSTTAGGWSFGGLIQTISSKSESVIETYRRDLQEFGSGLKKEIEVAQGSLETVGHVFDEFGSNVLKGTAQIIAQGKDAILSVDHESDSDTNSSQNYGTQRNSSSKPYSRFDAQIRTIQSDTSTYCEEPEDMDDYGMWKSQFLLEDKSEEIENLLEENGAIDNIHKKVVPNIVDDETFWYRYFYRAHKLKQAEDMRANLVKRAISRQEEDLSWDVDDDDDEEEEEEEYNDGSKGNAMKNKEASDIGYGETTKDEEKEEIVGEKITEENVKADGEEVNVTSKDDLFENKEMGNKASESELVVKEIGSSGGDDKVGEKDSPIENLNKNVLNVEESDDTVHLEGGSGQKDKDQVLKSDDKEAAVEGKSDNGESSKDSDVSVVSTQPSMQEEEDLGWDEIEDLSSIDDKKVTHGGIANREEMRKRLTVADDEYLSWDIEDDDEPAKA